MADFDAYYAKYCESCGQLLAASDGIVGAVREPVHRVHILEAVGEPGEVAETTAVELGGCGRCGGQVV
jgi:hypothetical protein